MSNSKFNKLPVPKSYETKACLQFLKGQDAGKLAECMQRIFGWAGEMHEEAWTELLECVCIAMSPTNWIGRYSKNPQGVTAPLRRELPPMFKDLQPVNFRRIPGGSMQTVKNIRGKDVRRWVYPQDKGATAEQTVLTIASGNGVVVTRSLKQLLNDIAEGMKVLETPDLYQAYMRVSEYIANIAVNMRDIKMIITYRHNNSDEGRPNTDIGNTQLYMGSHSSIAIQQAVGASRLGLSTLIVAYWNIYKSQMGQNFLNAKKTGNWPSIPSTTQSNSAEIYQMIKRKGPALCEGGEFGYISENGFTRMPQSMTKEITLASIDSQDIIWTTTPLPFMVAKMSGNDWSMILKGNAAGLWEPMKTSLKVNTPYQSLDWGRLYALGMSGLLFTSREAMQEISGHSIHWTEMDFTEQEASIIIPTHITMTGSPVGQHGVNRSNEGQAMGLGYGSSVAWNADVLAKMIDEIEKTNPTSTFGVKEKRREKLEAASKEQVMYVVDFNGVIEPRMVKHSTFFWSQGINLAKTPMVFQGGDTDIKGVTVPFNGKISSTSPFWALAMDIITANSMKKEDVFRIYDKWGLPAHSKFRKINPAIFAWMSLATNRQKYLNRQLRDLGNKGLDGSESMDTWWEAP